MNKKQTMAVGPWLSFARGLLCLMSSHIFIHLLKLTVPIAEAVAASILCVTAAVAEHPWTSIMGCNRPRRIV